MRKFIVAAAVAAVGSGLLATPASAFDHHFGVLAKAIAGRQTGEHAFRFRQRLYDPDNRHDRVGRVRNRCRILGSHHFRCHSVFFLNGEIGGQGKIKTNGDVQGGRDTRLNVTGGTEDFDGVGGKLVFHRVRGGSDWEKYHFDLVG
jgi:hypothetical protein